MEELLEILEDIQPGVDYANCKTLIDDHILDSFGILSLVSEIEDAFDIEAVSYTHLTLPTILLV